MIGGIASRYTGGRFTASGAVADVGFKLSELYTTTNTALGINPITTSVAGWTTPVTTYAADDYTTVVLPFNGRHSSPGPHPRGSAGPIKVDCVPPPSPAHPSYCSRHP